ncbi:MAG: hypothetical protein Q7S87_06845 [Agitococcus sp.]|nr:hypothetical protein [Agitococcus sp.]MDO9179962.1 hypothetical protein [Agitococcus sp.]
MMSIGPAGFGQAPKIVCAPTSEIQPKIGYLLKDRQERYNLKRGWFVNAWRIVDAAGRDLVQPWFNTKTAARTDAKLLGIKLIETPFPELG